MLKLNYRHFINIASVRILLLIIVLFARYGRRFSKRTKQWCRTKVLVPKKYEYIRDLMLKVFYKRVDSGGKVKNVDTKIGLDSDDPRNISPNIAPVPPPSVKALVEGHKTRF